MSILSGRGGTLCARSVAIAKDLSHGLPTLGVEKPRPSAIPATNELMQSENRARPNTGQGGFDYKAYNQ